MFSVDIMKIVFKGQHIMNTKVVPLMDMYVHMQHIKLASFSLNYESQKEKKVAS